MKSGKSQEIAVRFENNFVLVAPDIMIDPALKVIFREGRFELDNAAHRFSIEHNPELRADNLQRAMSAEEIAKYDRLGIPRPKQDLVPNIPGESRIVFFLSVFETAAGDQVTLELNADEKAFYRWRDLVANAGISPISENPDEFIEYIVESTFDWYSLTGAFGVTPIKGRFVFFLKNTFAQLLPTYKSRPFDVDSAGNVLFAQKEVSK